MARHTIREVTITIDPEEDSPAGRLIRFYLHGGAYYPSEGCEERPTFPANEIAARVWNELEALTGPPRAVGDPVPMLEELDRLRRIEAAARAWVDAPGTASAEYKTLAAFFR